MHTLFRVSRVCTAILFAASPIAALAQVPVERVDTAVIEKIKEEGMKRSKVMESRKRELEELYAGH